jgi:hypothetical protein
MDWLSSVLSRNFGSFLHRASYRFDIDRWDQLYFQVIMIVFDCRMNAIYCDEIGYFF